MLERFYNCDNFVVYDLEWNQGFAYSNYRMPHEIIEIGACKTDGRGNINSQFSQMIRPVVYRKIDRHIQKVTGITQREIEDGDTFEYVYEEFCRWSENAFFITWGRDDFPVFKRNIEFFNQKLKLNAPIDLQLIFGFIQFKDESRQINLHQALDMMKIDSDIPAHRALYDSISTCLLLSEIVRGLENLTDVERDHLEKILEKEKCIAESKVICLPTRYKHYVEAISDKRVTEFSCPICSKKISFEIPWFDEGKEKFSALGNCEEHGKVQGIIHFRRDTRGNLVANKRMIHATDIQTEAVERKYALFKSIPEKKRHHRIEMKMEST